MRAMFFRLGVVVLLSAGLVAAHPLGNFSINQYSRLEVGSSRLKVRQVLDMAEIPTYQEFARVDADRDGKLSQPELDAYAASLTTEMLARLQLALDGQALQMTARRTVPSIGIGAGDLPILRVEWDLDAKLPDGSGAEHHITFRNGNFPDRVGWNEIVVSRDAGISVYDSTAFGSGLTDELRSYPQELIASPLAERSAEFRFTSAPMPAGARPLRNRDGHTASPVAKDRLAELIAVPAVTPAIAIIGLLAAFGLGATHAMSPGHGKAVVGAYLVGSKGTPRHAAFLGLVVTVTHTLGVFVLGFITLFASRFILPERLMPALSFASGLLVLYIGLTMFKSRLFAALGSGNGDSHDHHHDGPHGPLTHTHGGSTHTHLPADDISWKNLTALGVSGGLLPCPSALVLMLSAINLDRVGYGLVLTTAFSFGLAGTLTAVGLLFLYGGKMFDGERFRNNAVVRVLPVISSFVIACLGAVICYTSL